MPKTNRDFLDAIQDGNLEAVAAMLDGDASLAGTNFLPDSQHTLGFPLNAAAQRGDFEMVKLLLEAGADPDAKLDVDNPRETGMPLLNALHGGHYEIVHLILDYKPSLNAHPYCSTPFVDQLFNNMWDRSHRYQPGQAWQYKANSAEIVANLFRESYSNYLNRQLDNSQSVSENASDFDELKLLRRVVASGGQPSLFTLVRHELHDLTTELLSKCALAKGTPMDWPQGTVFDNIVYAASWCGYPKTIELCMNHCPELYSIDVAKHAIERAIRSHNRDGDIDQYFELINTQLEFLKQNNGLSESFTYGSPFLPLHWLAEDFVEPSHYGFKCERLGTESDVVQLAKLFVGFGFKPSSINPKTQFTAQQTAENKNWMKYAEFLSGVNDEI